MKLADSIKEDQVTTIVTGKLGEAVAAHYLEKQGLEVIEMNYQKTFGEIDIVARERDLIHFVEVKTVSHETIELLKQAVSRETWRPEEQVHQRKLHQISKAIQAWISEHSYTGNIQIDVLALRIVPRETFCSINWLQNVIIDES